MSQVHIEDISIEDLVGYAQYILVVEKEEPFMNKETITFENPKCPNFEKISNNFKVIEILKSMDENLKIGDSIKAFQAFTQQKMELHKKYYLEGESKSPIYPEYNSKSDFESPQLIIFLNSEHEFASIHAYEDISKKGEIEKILRG